MLSNLKLLISSALVALTFSAPQISSQAMESVTAPITFIQPDNKRMVMKVNLDQPLSDLRSELISKGRISLEDIFQHKGGDIFPDDEKDWTIREVIMDNALSLKPRDSVSHLFGNTTSNALEYEASQFSSSLMHFTQTIEDMKKQLEATQREVDDLRKFWDAEIAQRRRDEQEKVAAAALWNSSIDTTIQRIKDLQNYRVAPAR